MKVIKRLAKVIALISVVTMAVMLFAVPALADSTPVTITGTVTSVVGNDFVITEDVLLSDITVDAGPIWYQAVDLVVGDVVSVYGEWEGIVEASEFDAFTITVTSDEPDTIITIKGPGKPPWAGVKGKGK